METTKVQATRFDAVQSLRFLCFMVVFGVHAGFLSGGISGIILQIFVVMSGFMMMYATRNKDLKVNPWASIKFAINKISKIYPLHAITTTLQWGIMLWYWVMLYKGIAPFEAVVKVVFSKYPEYLLHMGLLHAWVPDETVNFMFNGPSWYLSVTVFTYLCFPLILKLIRAIKQKAGVILLGVITLVLMYIATFLVHKYGNASLYTWITAHSPLTKLGDFIVGCVLGRLYIDWMNNRDSNKGYSRLAWTGIEILGIASVVGLAFLLRSNAIVGIYDNRSFTTMVGFNLVAVFLVLLFVLNRGFITKIIGNKVFVFLGDISAYTYLTHYIFTIVWTDICNVYHINAIGWIKVVAIIVEFILTTASGALCYYIIKKNAQKKKLKLQGNS